MPKIKSIRCIEFKRFTDLTITGIPAEAKLVVLIGPNGCGKTSVFEALNVWNQMRTGSGSIADVYNKNGKAHVNVDLHSIPSSEHRQLFYFRSSQRASPKIYRSRTSDVPPDLEEVGSLTLKEDLENRVSANIQKMIDRSMNTLYGPDVPNLTQVQIRDQILDKVRLAMKNVLGPELSIDSLKEVSYFPKLPFSKGTSREFDFANLSGGEKAAFDLLLDFIMKTDLFSGVVACIDEPELHMHTQLQGSLMREVYRQIPRESQLWISTHAIGVIREALEIHAANSSEVVFLDFDLDFDLPQAITPAPVNRGLWKKAFKVALHGLADLVSPERIVICEGRSPSGSPNRDKPDKAEFDAKIYRKIFSNTYPDTEFVASGACNDIIHDSTKIASAFGTLLPGVQLIKIIDRDCERNADERKDLLKGGIKILSRREIENYLWSDEILIKLCTARSKGDQIAAVLASKNNLLGKGPTDATDPCDDVKSIRGGLLTKLKQLVSLPESGSTPEAFALSTLAPLLTPETESYKALEKDIFR